ncbi:MAG: phage tail assembly chaperone [Caulobacteraceae bacterium]|nr:phage tail assembly chaperone [Caulobacteraceae bacterium]
MLRTASALGVPPEAFWRLSLKEWRMLTERAGEPTMGRAAMEGLMARWPDGAWGESPSTASRSPSPSLRDEEET